MTLKRFITTRVGDLSTKRDCRALIKLLNAYRTHPMGGRLPMYSSREEASLIKGLKGSRNAILLFALSANIYVGAAVCFTGFSTFSAKPLMNVHDLIVSSRYRRRGVGERIMKAIVQKAKTLGCCRVTLEVRSDNSIAKHLYTKCGFGPCLAPMEFWIRPIGEES